ncbi:unnamed protein product [Prunus brigantina]
MYEDLVWKVKNIGRTSHVASNRWRKSGVTPAWPGVSTRKFQIFLPLTHKKFKT